MNENDPGGVVTVIPAREGHQLLLDCQGHVFYRSLLTGDLTYAAQFAFDRPLLHYLSYLAHQVPVDSSPFDIPSSSLSPSTIGDPRR